MPSRADTRRSVEWALRGVTLLLLAGALWRSVHEPAHTSDGAALSASGFSASFESLLKRGRSVTVDFNADATPSRSDRDVLVALRRSGNVVRWHGEIPALALAVSRAREPYSEGRIAIIGGGDSPLALVDSAGLLDSVRAGNGATLEANSLVGNVRARSSAFQARALVPEASSRRAVLVLGRVGWEVKFVAAALTEVGWSVRSSSPAAPGIIVRDDAIFPLDTARYDAVVALDSTAGEFTAQILRFVSQGGGVVAVGAALDLPGLREVAPAAAGDRRPGRILLAEDTVTPRDLPMRALLNERSDAVTLTRSGSELLVAARRVGLGRVLSVGYDETWRWRMLGGESGLASHRDWWSRAVGSVSPEREASPHGDGDAAPRAALIDALGPPTPAAAQRAALTDNPLPMLLLAVIVMATCVEIASRRFRGER